MPVSYRKSKGPIRVSASKRGVRVGTSMGCLLPILAAVALLVLIGS